MLTLLAVLALPMQTSAHRGNGIANPQAGGDHRYLNAPDTPLPDIIQWIRVYKNPEIVHRTDLSDQEQAGTYEWRPVFRFDALGIPITSQLNPSFLGPDYNRAEDTKLFWVKFKPTNDADDPGGLFDTGDNSGLVTATENTAVGVDDIVAIAIRVKDLGEDAVPDIAIGPLETRVYRATPVTRRQDEGGGTETVLIPHSERRWRLSPNLPIRHLIPSGNFWIRSSPPGSEHTLVYQFTVTADHAAELNTDGPWLKQDFKPYLPTGPRPAGLVWFFDPGSGYHGHPFSPPGNLQTQVVERVGATNPDNDGTRNRVWPIGFEWIFGEASTARHPSPTSRPSPTSLRPFNTHVFVEVDLVEWGVYARIVNGLAYEGWTFHKLVDTPSYNDYQNNPNHAQGTDYAQRTHSHYHVPRYDPALPGKEAIFYPKIERPGSRASTTMDVPSGTQTGEFTVTLKFADGGIFEGHNLSPTGLETFKEALEKALADSGWTVESLSIEEEKRPKVASSGAEITPFSPFTEYQLTLSPPKGVKGEVSLTIPENVVLDAGDNGNHALEEPVMISVDTSLEELRLAAGESVKVTEPAGGAYLAGNALEVLVPFDEDGLTYEGDNPPYLTIYLGAGTENPRHATWQKGEESAGSTIVPFKYTIAATDPIVSSVRVDTAAGVLRPVGTTLMNGDGQVWVVGTDPMPMASGKKAPAPAPSDTNKVSLATSTGETVTPPEAVVQVLPAVLLPPTEESAPKAGMSSIPRSPIVFNELGNGSGDTNDWLELRNVTGDAVSLKDWELSVVQDGKKEDTSLVIFPDVSVPANGLLLLTNQPSDKTPLAGGDDIAVSDEKKKGLSHLTLVNDKLSLPDDGQFLLILRNVKEKRGLNEAFVDVAGGGGSGTDAFVREQEGDYDTYVWPLQVLEAPGSATEDALSSGKVWLRAKADIVGYHRDAWAEAAFTGVGYDRKVSKSAETAGTPGYPNGAVKTEAPTPRGAITISEVMLDSAGGTLPQWVELYNSSKTDALNLNRWELEIQNVDSEELVGRPIVRLTLQEKVIQPNQTLLIVTGTARASSADVYPADRVYNLLELHDKNLRIKKPSDTFLSATGFYLRLTDRNEHLVDEVGNTDGNRRTDDTPAWALPVPLSELEGMRSSLIRRYDKGVARDGKEKSSWALAANFAKFKAEELHYGHADDIGTPGYRQGGALPVELSSFTVTRVESGSVIVTWTTESEVDNAGFNLRRSLTRDGGFTLLNPVLIAGAGTTGERQTYTYIDTSAKPGVEHYYQIEEVSFGGKAEPLVTRRLRGPVSPAHRALKTLGEVKQRDE